jgi:hypothetical protein
VNKLKEKDLVNYIVVNSRYQVINEKGEPTSEFAQGIFRNGVRLKLAVKLYLQLIDKQGSGSAPWNGEAKRMAKAAELATTAFALSDIFLEEMDKHFRTPLPEENGSKRG